MRLLRRAYLFAIPGSLLLISPGQPFAFLMGISLIAFGYIPYKRLCRIEESPICLRCSVDHIELSQKRRTRRLPAKSLIGFSQKGTYLEIEMEGEKVQIAHFPPGTAGRIQELYR